MEKGDTLTSQSEEEINKQKEKVSSISPMMEKVIKIRLASGRVLEGTKANHVLLALTIFCDLVIPIQIFVLIILSQKHIDFQSLESSFQTYNTIYGIVKNIAIIWLAVKYLILSFVWFQEDLKQWLYIKLVHLTINDKISDKILLTISGLLLWFDFKENIAIFIGASILRLISGILLENYGNMGDISYMTSVSTNQISIGFKVVSYLLSVIYWQTREPALIYMTILMLIPYIFWFLTSGFKQYIHKLPMWLNRIYAAAFIATTLTLFTSQMSNKPRLKISSEIIDIVVMFVIVLAFLFVRGRILLNLKSKDFKKQSIKTLEYLMCTDENICDNNGKSKNQVIVLGLLKLHRENKCLNPKCFKDEKYHYGQSDSFNLNDKAKENMMKLKMFIKCLYESSLLNNPDDPELLTNFFEFLFTELRSDYLCCNIYLKMRYKKIGFMDRIKIEVMLGILKERRKKFNKLLYESQMDIQSVLQAQETFEELMLTVRKYLKGLKETWKTLQQNEINLFTLKSRLHELFEYLKQVDSKWSLLTPYFKVNKLWHYFYLFTLVFMKNKMISRKDLERMKQCQNWLKTCKEMPQFIIKSQNQKVYLNNKILFHFDSFYLHATENADDLVIKNMSNNVKDITGYAKNQLINCSIQRLMVDDLKLTHKQKMREWLNNGMNMNDESFLIRKTKMVDKYRNQVSVVKYFKMFVNKNQQMQYVCLLKVNQIEEWQMAQNMGEREEAYDERASLLRKDEQNLPLLTGNEQLEESMQLDVTVLRNKYPKSEQNPFLKQDSYTIAQKDGEVSKIKISLRLFFVLILIAMGLTKWRLDISLDNMSLYNYRYFTFMSTYRIPMILGNNYYKSILNVGDQVNVVNQINTLTKQMRQIIANPDIIRTVHDSTINLPKMYSPFMANAANQNLNYTQVDLFYVLSSNIIALQKLPINHQGRQFQMFNSYLKPSYDDLINSTKNQFHHQFHDRLVQIQMGEIYVLVSIVIVGLIFMAFVLYKIKCFLTRLKTITKVMVEVKKNFQIKVDNYLSLLYNQFKRVSNFNELFRLQASSSDKIMPPNEQDQENEQTGKVNLNNKTKTFIQDRNQKKDTIKMVLLVVVGFIICFLALTTSTINNLQNTTELLIFQQDGWGFLKYFPTATVVGFGCMEKLYSQTYPNETTFYPERYSDVLASMKMVGDFQFLRAETKPQSHYYQTRRNYFFGNPCRYNPKVLENIGIGISTCETIINQSFARGLAAYMRAGSTLAESYIKGQKNLTKAELSQFSLSVSVLSGYVLSAIVTWGNEFNDRIAEMKQVALVVILLTALVIVLSHIILFQWLLFGLLDREYEFCRKVFTNMIPEELLIRQKVVLQELINEGLIS